VVRIYLLSAFKLRIQEKDITLTLIQNKAYKNINFFSVVHENDIRTFTDKIVAIESKQDYEKFVGLYGVRRTSSRFWKEADFNRYNNR